MAQIGIDLGTTYSVIASMEDHRVEVWSNAEGRQTTPSVVFFQDGDLNNAIVGESAVYSFATNPLRGVRKIKRYMGTDFKFEIDGKNYTPEEISGAILKKLKRDAEANLGGETVTAAVITVPAYFEAPERTATQRAADIAGLKVLVLLSEPIAAAIDFAQTKKESLAGKTVMVYDLGGGTFDVTVMSVRHENDDPSKPLDFAILGKDGDRELGGVDWDKALAEHVAQQFAQAHGQNPLEDVSTFELLLLECQKAKETLSHYDANGKVSINCNYKGIPHNVEVTRAEFEAMTKHLLDQTATKTNELIARLADKGVSWEKLDFILLAGGSTKMPCVPEMLERTSGKKPVTHKGVDFNVGRGAAYVAFSPGAWTTGAAELTIAEQNKLANHGPTGRLVFRDIANHSVGIKVYDRQIDKDYNHILIKKDSPVNQRSKEEYFETFYPDQKEVDIIIYKGETADLGQAEELGMAKITGLPGGPAGQQIKVWLCYNGDGIITGEATHVPSGTKVDIKVSINLRKEFGMQ